MSKKHSILLGCHLSIAGGFYKAVERAALLGCTTFQIFTKSNRQWHAKSIAADDVALFTQTLAQHPAIKKVVAHASYLINIASEHADLANKSMKSLAIELERCAQLSIPYLVLHPGSALKQDRAEALKHVSYRLDKIIEEHADVKTMIVLETMAGQGSSLGNSFEELALIRKKMAHRTRVGICLDTCHVFTAGYDFSEKKGYKKMWDSFDEVIGLEHLKVIHLNDSKTALDSHVDRHEHIGKGKIGLEGFRLLCTDEHLKAVPKILETPKKEDLAWDRKNMETIYSLL
jgi:deoxyribonuclease-4